MTLNLNTLARNFINATEQNWLGTDEARVNQVLSEVHAGIARGVYERIQAINGSADNAI